MLGHRLTKWSVAVALVGLFVHVSSVLAAEDVWPKYEDRCKKVLEQLTARQFAELEADCSAAMKETFPASRLAPLCNPLLDAVGDLGEIVDHQLIPTPVSEFTSFELWVRPSKSKNLLKLNLTFDQADKITGLLLTPTTETVPPLRKGRRAGGLQDEDTTGAAVLQRMDGRFGWYYGRTE